MGLFFEHWDESNTEDISIGATLLSSDYREGIPYSSSRQEKELNEELKQEKDKLDRIKEYLEFFCLNQCEYCNDCEYKLIKGSTKDPTCKVYQSLKILKEELSV